jgi:uracil-DNA glycosylase
VKTDFETLVEKVRACTICTAHLPLGPRPVFQIHPKSKILIASQAPGRKVHETGIPFNDPSGNRLREWMGISRDVFYDPKKIAILAMGFCYPGTGASGDLPPRPECALEWRNQLLAQIPDVQLTLVIGTYAIDWHLGKQQKPTLTDTVKSWAEYWPNLLPLPHPSPRNNIWLTKNAWFEETVIPVLRKRVGEILSE